MHDYIIVGAGSAGCVLANRLTTDPDTSVLLLEAGGNDDAPAIRDPNAAFTLFHTAVDWGYSTLESLTAKFPFAQHHECYPPIKCYTAV